jgi:hypothetical protein
MLLTDETGFAKGRVAFKAGECIPPIEGIPQPTPMRIRGTLMDGLLNREVTVTLILFPGQAPW